MKHSLKTLSAALLLAGIGFSSVAQTPPPPPAGAPMHQQHGMREGRGPMDPARMEQRRKRMEERMARRQAELKQKLAITPAQEGAWAAWTGAIKPAAQAAQRPSREEFARMTTPQRIDRMRELRAQRMARMDARMNATKTFYAALSPEQQKVFDQESVKRGGRHGGHGGHGRHHRG